MTKTGRSDRLRGLRRAGQIALGVAISLFLLCRLIGLRINSSPSLPIGLYVTTEEGGANLAEFCPAKPFGDLAIARGYRDAGNCRDGAAPLLKPVVARPADVVELSDRGLTVNGRILPNTAPIPTDTKGRPLSPWPFGRNVVQPGTVWVASSFNSRSFDSRYFGPVQISAIRDYLRPLLTAGK
jgi:conjugative transfer signal peptidase TraF